MAEEKEINEQGNENIKKENESAVEDANGKGSDAVDSDSVNNNETKELTQEEKYAELNDKFLRLFAEFDNYRKRTNKEKVELISNASESVLCEMLPVLDDFERAITNNETADDLQVVKEGFHLIFNKFKNILENKGLKPMNSKGQAFDSELHEAIANVPAPSNKEKGKVIEDVEKGYYLHDKVIRFAKVVVGQ